MDPIRMPLKGLEGTSGAGFSKAHCLVVAAPNNGVVAQRESRAPDPYAMPLHALEEAPMSNGGVPSIHKVCARRPLVLSMCIAVACYPSAEPLIAALVQVHRLASRLLGKPLLVLYLTTAALEVDRDRISSGSLDFPAAPLLQPPTVVPR